MEDLLAIGEEVTSEYLKDGTSIENNKNNIQHSNVSSNTIND